MQQLTHDDLFDDMPTNQDEDQWEEIPEEEMHTVHVYVYEDHSSWWTKDRCVTLAMGLLALALIVGLCCLPSGPSYQLQTLRLPAHFSTVTLKTSVPLIPTGKQVYPATRATGTLTIYNGSLFTEQLPAHFVVTTASGVEVATSQAVVIPGANLPIPGVATVPASAVVPGSQGNIPPEAIQAAYGSSIEIKNLAAFTGGQDALTRAVITPQDRNTALSTARTQLAAKRPIGLQSHPCSENVSQQSSTIVVTWSCQYVTYQVPTGVDIRSVRLSGAYVMVTVKIVARSVTTHFVK
jgi:hypothetical protein